MNPPPLDRARREQAALLPMPLVLTGLLAEAGVRRVYAVPGDMTYDLLRSCGEGGLSVVSCRSHAAAVFAAEADSFCGGALASIVMLSRGPGLAQALPAAASAAAQGAPLLVLAPVEGAADAARGAFQGETAPPPPEAGLEVTRLDDPATAPAALTRALRRLTGPARAASLVLVDRPVLSARPVPPAPPLKVAEEAPVEPDRGALDRAAEAMARADRAAIVVGHGARWSLPLDALRAFAARLGAVVCPTGLTLGFGGAGFPATDLDGAHEALRRADLVLLLGASMDWTLRLGAAIAQGATVVQLPGAGPEPRQARRPDLLLRGDIGAALERLSRRLPARSRAAAQPPASPRHKHAPRGLLQEVVAALARDFPEDAALVVDGGTPLIHAARSILPAGPWARMGPGREGHLGGGLGHAIGACATGRFGRVILLTGDFSLGLSLADLETLLRYRLPVKVVVCNNSGIGSGRRQMRGADPRMLDYCDGVDHAAIMQGFGGRGVRVRSIEEWGAVAPGALADGEPCLLEIVERERAEA